MSKKNYDLIVIGGGHAGIEAAFISAKLGKKVVLITLDKNKIGFMPCNPRIGGGGGKGIVAREIDALRGMMGLVADATALQFKLLNASSGPAIQSLRVQSDKVAYARYMQKMIAEQENLEVIEGAVQNLLIKDNVVYGVELKNQKITAQIVILTTGTYLQPLTYRGKEIKIEGPDGEKKVVNGLSQQLQTLGFNLKRFKTGTCPRVLRDSIDFSQTKLEPGTNLPLKFSSRSKLENLLPFTKQKPCHLLYTNEKIHQIIRENLHLSPILYKENIGVGPRYCPSLEHKIFYFAEKERHQVFLEEESEELNTIYLQGFSTSLPVEVQEKILKNLPGLERARVEKWGYAIEYDAIDATQLKKNLETKLIKNLFMAGQLNGTSGYEEAAAQGLLAGINASRKIDKQNPLILGRDQAYIGVLIDDLVTKEINEPYRLLTSRAEYRLLLRHDNVYTRLWPITYELGLLPKEEWINFCQRKIFIEKVIQRLKEVKVFTDDPQILSLFPNLNNNQKKFHRKVSIYDLLKKNEIFLSHFFFWLPEIKQLSWEEAREIEVNIKYEGYIKRQIEEVQRSHKYEKKSLPKDINYSQVSNLSTEAREKLNKIRPNTLGQAMRISGVNPTDIQILNFYLRRIYPNLNNGID